MGNDNLSSRPTAELLSPLRPLFLESNRFASSRRKRPFVLALVLFVFTVISTLAVGREFSLSYA